MRDFSYVMKDKLKKFNNESSSYVASMVSTIKNLEESNNIIEVNLNDINDYIIDLGKTKEQLEKQQQYNQSLIDNYKKLVNYDEFNSLDIEKER